MQQGCKLGIDSYADTSVAGKHAHVIDFIDGKKVTAKAWNNQKTTNLNIANVAYAYDSPTGQTIILLVNQAIYGGNMMEDSLLQPIQCLHNNVIIDTRPKSFYPNDNNSQSISFQDKHLPLEFNGPLPFLHVRRPTSKEFNTCPHFDLTSHDDWDPYNPDSTISAMKDSTFDLLTPDEELKLMSDICSISSELIPSTYFSVLDDYRELYLESNTDFDDKYRSISAFRSNKQNSLTPEELARLWNIGLKLPNEHLWPQNTHALKQLAVLPAVFVLTRLICAISASPPDTANSMLTLSCPKSNQSEVSPVETSTQTA